jgi:hypothetical protein
VIEISGAAWGYSSSCIRTDSLDGWPKPCSSEDPSFRHPETQEFEALISGTS